MKRVVIMTILIAGMTMLASAEYVTPPEGLRLRKEPSLDAEIIRVLPFGTEVEGIVSAGWMKTDDGYLKAEYLSEDDPLENAEYLGEWRITAYAATGNLTASGTVPQVGWTLATNDLPFGSILYISGQGVWRVEDRGPQSLGSAWCDLFLGDTATCIAFGETRADVYLLGINEN